MIDINKDIIGRILKRSLSVSIIAIIPLNIIVWIALKNSNYTFPKYFTPILSSVILLLMVSGKNLKLKFKIWGIIFVFFSGGIFTLFLGLLDMATLWFILSIIYTLFIAQKNEAVYIFVISFILVLTTGILMITKSTFIPIDYGFDKCQFACVFVRIFNFLFTGFLIYDILNLFFSALKENVEDLTRKTKTLTKLNETLKSEMSERKKMQEKILETVILTEEKERKRIAADLHDGLGPVISAINLYFQAYVDAKKDDKTEIKNKLENIISGAIKDVSRISHNISPHILEQQGLAEAVTNFVSELSINNKISFDLQIEKIQRFDLQKELTIYRAIKELINNTLKYADASKIVLEIRKTDNKLIIKYSDNGKGFNSEISQKGMGIINIKSRINSLNGKLTIKSKKNKGMKADIEIPVSFKN